jgi:hypothetical protein
MTSSIPVLGIFDIHQTEIRLVDECSGLKGLPRCLLRHLLSSQLAEFIVDEGNNCSAAFPAPSSI